MLVLPARTRPYCSPPWPTTAANVMRPFRHHYFTYYRGVRAGRRSPLQPPPLQPPLSDELGPSHCCYPSSRSTAGADARGCNLSVFRFSKSSLSIDEEFFAREPSWLVSIRAFVQPEIASIDRQPSLVQRAPTRTRNAERRARPTTDASEKGD